MSWLCRVRGGRGRRGRREWWCGRGSFARLRFLISLCDLASDTMHRRLGWGAKYRIGKASSLFFEQIWLFSAEVTIHVFCEAYSDLSSIYEFDSFGLPIPSLGVIHT